MPVRNSSGFTLIELMITVGIIAILAAIAIPSYLSYITASRRAAAEACLSNYADFMERFYATNMSYSADTLNNAVTNITLSNLNLDCASAQNTGANYGYTFNTTLLTQSTFTLQATPIPGTSQAKHDTLCATLTLDQQGNRGDTGTASASPSSCWQH